MHNLSVMNLLGNPSLLAPVLDWCYREWWQEPGSTDDELKEILKNHTEQESIFTTFVALCDRKPVGSVHFIDKDFDTGDYQPCLAGLYVLPGFRHIGVGALLVDIVVSHAKNQGFTALYLSTASVEKWYSKLGWKTIDTINESSHHVLMKKVVASD
jgi:N-acetylglutamate synthase-like GNAT family acetyltransferase